VAAVCDNNFVLDYFRTTPDHRLLYGGRVSYSTATPTNLAESHAQAHGGAAPSRNWAACRWTHAWGGFVDISMNRAPDFGRCPAGRCPQVYYLQGFSGHGLALTGLAGGGGRGHGRRRVAFRHLRALKHRRFPAAAAAHAGTGAGHGLVPPGMV
jgi:gamma-glutamylputrescine oxidase